GTSCQAGRGKSASWPDGSNSGTCSAVSHHLARTSREPGPAPRAEPDADSGIAPIVNDQSVRAEPGRVVDETVGAIEAVRVLVALPLDLTPHVLATVPLHRLTSVRRITPRYLFSRGSSLGRLAIRMALTASTCAPWTRSSWRTISSVSACVWWAKR